MIFHLNLLHLALALGALACVALAMQEIRRREILTRWLFLPPLLALAVACGLALLQIAETDRAPWLFGAAWLAGAAIGAVRGASLIVELSQYQPAIRTGAVIQSDRWGS